MHTCKIQISMLSALSTGGVPRLSVRRETCVPLGARLGAAGGRNSREHDWATVHRTRLAPSGAVSSDRYLNYPSPTHPVTLKIRAEYICLIFNVTNCYKLPITADNLTILTRLLIRSQGYNKDYGAPPFPRPARIAQEPYIASIGNVHVAR